jgi:hypothetical protein
MTSTKCGLGRLICGTEGALLIVSLFSTLGGSRGCGPERLGAVDDGRRLSPDRRAGRDRNGADGWALRPLSTRSLAERRGRSLGVVATVLLVWLVIFDFPEGASREIGVFLALIGAMAVAGGAGDYATPRGAPLFPKKPRRPVRERSKGDDCLPWPRGSGSARPGVAPF